MTAPGSDTPGVPGSAPSGAYAPVLVPAPPPGPGVQPPFVHPPTDGVKQRRLLAFGLAGATVLVLCVGGIFGIGALLVFGSQMISDQARTAVTEYLTAVQNEDYAQAYTSLCDTERARLDESRFARSFANSPGIRSFTVGDPILTDRMVVPATIRFDDGSSDAVRYLLEQDTSTGEFEVCGEQG